MTDQSVVRPTDFAQPRHRDRGLSSPNLETMETQLAEAVRKNNKSTQNGQQTDQASVSAVQLIACALKELTYDQAQEVGAGLAQSITDNADKEKGFDFSNSPIKLAPVLSHLIQTWASSVKNAMQQQATKVAGQD